MQSRLRLEAAAADVMRPVADYLEFVCRFATNHYLYGELSEGLLVD